MRDVLSLRGGSRGLAFSSSAPSRGKWAQASQCRLQVPLAPGGSGGVGEFPLQGLGLEKPGRCTHASTCVGEGGLRRAPCSWCCRPGAWASPSGCHQHRGL